MLNFKQDKITNIQNALHNADVNQDKQVDFEELSPDLKA